MSHMTPRSGSTSASRGSLRVASTRGLQGRQPPRVRSMAMTRKGSGLAEATTARLWRAGRRSNDAQEGRRPFARAIAGDVKDTAPPGFGRPRGRREAHAGAVADPRTVNDRGHGRRHARTRRVGSAVRGCVASRPGVEHVDGGLVGRASAPDFRARSFVRRHVGSRHGLRRRRRSRRTAPCLAATASLAGWWCVRRRPSDVRLAGRKSFHG